MKRLILLIVLCVVLINPGCEKIDFGSTNKNVNGPKDPNTGSLLSGSIARYYTRTGRPLWVTPSLYVQYMTQLVYVDEMLYADVPQSWDTYYAQILSNLKMVIDICEDPANALDPIVLANGSIGNQLGVAKIMKAIIFKRVTDVYGDIPYSEALSSSNFLPAYDSQESIYKAMIADLKAARDGMANSVRVTKGDIIFGGGSSHVGKWQKLENSLILEFALQLSKKYPGVAEYAAVEFNAALTNGAGVIETISDEAWFNYDALNSWNNPWNWIRPADYSMSKEFCDALRGETGVGELNSTSNTTYDNRIILFADDADLEGLGYGYTNETDAPGAYSAPSGLILSASVPLPIMTAAYTFLNRAEAAARGWNAENVSNMLEDGILASYETLGDHYAAVAAELEIDISGLGDGSAYAAARVADIATAPGGAIQVICEEKWVALFPCGFDAWAEWRRTGYPALTPAADAINGGVIPRRFNYPSTEATLNRDSYLNGITKLAPATDNNSSKMWWDQ